MLAIKEAYAGRSRQRRDVQRGRFFDDRVCEVGSEVIFVPNVGGLGFGRAV